MYPCPAKRRRLTADTTSALDTSPGRNLEQSRTHYRVLTYRAETNALIAPEKRELKFELKITAWLPTLFTVAKRINFHFA
jgi:hypothetical protein